MATNISELRKILRLPITEKTRKFNIIKEVSNLVNNNQSVGQEFVLRLLSRITEFADYANIISGLTRQVGLFPYLDKDDLSLKDAIAYEFHKPEGLNNIVFHSAQAEVYYYLLNGENVVLSAPTSFGKSLVVDSIIASNTYSNIMIVVPTIALIDETRKRLSSYRDTYKIITHSSQNLSDKNIFILTQERALEIISKQSIDFFVIDEFYKLSPNNRDSERCHILNQVFYRLVKSGAQFYLLGPNIEQVSTKLLDNIKFRFIKTDYKTVVSERHNIRINRGENSIEKLISLVQSMNEPTLVFCQSPASANKVATALASKANYDTTTNNINFSNWIKDNYHPKWIFANCIEKGIGIHHGKIPRSISQRCVKLFNEGALHVLVCTSTLIEGVNTKAKNVIIFDNKIARTKFDYFTFNNICGRSGRMFSHFIGNVYLFHEPPTEELPLIDFPIFSQNDDVPDNLLININEEDLKPASKAKLQKYTEQNILSKTTLQRNSYINLDNQIKTAKFITDNLLKIHSLMNWKTYPNDTQLSLSCKLIWDYLINIKGMQYGVSSSKQLKFRIDQFRSAGNIKTFIEHYIGDLKDEKEINSKIEEALDSLRHWINFQFPRYLISLADIANDVFERNKLPLCDYSCYANAVECYFTSPYVIPLDEYGLPVQVSIKIGNIINLSDNIDEALEQIKNFNLENQYKFTQMEKDFIIETKKYL